MRRSYVMEWNVPLWKTGQLCLTAGKSPSQDSNLKPACNAVETNRVVNSPWPSMEWLAETVAVSTHGVQVYIGCYMHQDDCLKYWCFAAAPPPPPPPPTHTHTHSLSCEDLRVARVVQRFMIPSCADAVLKPNPLPPPSLTVISGSSESRALIGF